MSDSSPMRILAIDSSCAAVCACVLEHGAETPLAARSLPMTRGHAEALAPMVEAVIAQVPGGFGSLHRIAVTNGPGSFTGIRIGIAMARAMGLALDIPVIGVSTLTAFAGPLLLGSGAGVIVSAIDARHGQVYFQLFEATGRPLIAPRVETLRDAARAIGAGPARLAGSAAKLLAEEFGRGATAFDASAAADFPDIAAVARIGLAASPDASPPRPIYLKAPSAQPMAEGGAAPA
jgi:tRNA threonylcarbamoyl adenosine modification protein YeaZ